MSQEKLIIFLKAPRLGTVKTRLAKDIGDEGALGAYQQMVSQLLDNLASSGNIEICYAPHDASEEIKTWLRPGWHASPQSHGDLGQRLISAINAAFNARAKRVVVIGSDCPDVNLTDIQAAWEALRSHDVVLGPATDGGYWLIGLRRPQPALFRNMIWSTENVFHDTLHRCQQMNLSVRTLRELSDIDTGQDWQAYRQKTIGAN